MAFSLSISLIPYRKIPYDCFDQTMTCMVSTYVKYFQLPSLEGKRVLVSFEGVSAYYDLYVNGKKAGSHKGSYSMALFDLTPFVKEGKNRMVLMVDSHERADIPPNGATVDYLIYGGIYRDVTLFIQEEIYVKHVMFRYDMEEGLVKLRPELLLENAGEDSPVMVETRLYDGEKEIFFHSQVLTVSGGSSAVNLKENVLEKIKPWSPENPVLYRGEINFLHRHRRSWTRQRQTLVFER